MTMMIDATPTLTVLTVETPSLGDRSYVVTDGVKAAVIDPQRDVDRIEALLSDRSLELTHVFETHVHNDYVTGGVELARRWSATYVLHSSDAVGFPHEDATPGATFEVGALIVRAIATPGHTLDHLAYVVSEGDEIRAVLTGGSMLYGTVGRTDLLGEGLTDALTRAQFHSVRGLAGDLDPRVAVFPTHGFGSFCSAASTSGSTSSTIGDERESNIALTAAGEDEFVTQLLAGLTAYPGYYAHMADINRRGPAPVDLDPPAAIDAAEVSRRVDAGEWVVDLRHRDEFARGHLRGTRNFALDTPFVTYLGWVMPWGAPLTLLANTPGDLAEAKRQLARIGIDAPRGVAGDLSAWIGVSKSVRYPTATFSDLAEATQRAEVSVLDVRRVDEIADGSIRGSVHVPLHELEGRLDDLPDGTLWVHCASGYRAAIAASILDGAGRPVVLVDDDFAGAVEARLTIDDERDR